MYEEKKKDVKKKRNISGQKLLEETVSTTVIHAPSAPRTTKLIVNGFPIELYVEPNWTLAQVLRDKLHLTGTKLMCQRGACGHCTVIMDGRPIVSCMTLAIECDGKSILTIEGLATRGTLHPIQQAWIDEMGYQCGACTPGFIMSTKALLAKHPDPTDSDIRLGLSGNLCLCGNLYMIMNAVKAAAIKMNALKTASTKE